MSFDCFVCFMKKDWEGDDQGGAWIDHAGLGNVRVGCRKFLPVFTRWLSSGYFIPDCYVYKVNDPAFHFSLRQRLVMLFGYAPGGGWDSTAEVTWAKFEYTHKIISGGCYTNEAKLQDFGKKNSPCGRCSHPPCCRRPHLECEEKEKWCETWKRKDNMSNDSRSTEWGAVNKKKTTRGNHQRRAERVGAEGKKCPVTLLFNLSTAVGRNDDDDILDVFFFFFHSAWKERELPSHDIISLDVKKMT